MRITVKSFSSTVVIGSAIGLAGCAPMMPEPVYEQQPYEQPQAQARPLPHYNQPPILNEPPTQQPRYQPPANQVQRQAQTQIAQAEPRPSTNKSKEPSWMRTPYPDSSKGSKISKTQTTPVWDDGKVQVEVLDLKKDTTTASAANGTVTTSVTPLNRSTSGDATSKASGTIASTTSSSAATSSTPPSISSSSFGSSNPAVAVLMRQANNELAAGNTSRAVSTLERALRITPDDANLWLRLAEVYQQQGDKRQASAMAEKAVAIAPDDANVRQRSQRFLN